MLELRVLAFIVWLKVIKNLVILVGMLKLPGKGVLEMTAGGAILVILWPDPPVVKVIL